MNCKECGSPHIETGDDICSDCFDDFEEDLLIEISKDAPEVSMEEYW